MMDCYKENNIKEDTRQKRGFKDQESLFHRLTRKCLKVKNDIFVTVNENKKDPIRCSAEYLKLKTTKHF